MMMTFRNTQAEFLPGFKLHQEKDCFVLGRSVASSEIEKNTKINILAFAGGAAFCHHLNPHITVILLQLTIIH